MIKAFLLIISKELFLLYF